jgi:hypothetical protein
VRCSMWCTSWWALQESVAVWEVQTHHSMLHCVSVTMCTLPHALVVAQVHFLNLVSA